MLYAGVPPAFQVDQLVSHDVAFAEIEVEFVAGIEQELRQLASPFRTAEAFAIEDLIDPRETRPYLCAFLEAAAVGMKTRVGPKYRSGVRP